MALARHAGTPRGVASAYASQIHPVFMLPPVAVSLFGAIAAGAFSVTLAVLHALAIFFAVYTAHVRDGFVDFHQRGEDADHPLTPIGCRVGVAVAAGGFATCLAVLALASGPLAVLLLAPCWAIGYLHAPYLDTNPVTTTLGYPVGIALSLLGGFAVQTGRLAAPVVSLATVFVIVLAGVKIVDDAQDYEYDRSIEKRTVAVALGMARARQVGFGLVAIGLLAVPGAVVANVLPPGAMIAVFLMAPVAAIARPAPASTATMLLIRGAYLFLAGLVVALWYRPFQHPPPVDIGVLGPYTYLATEVAFGVLALGLLVHAGALRSAAATVAALYPIAYVWDWYTLTVGVFEIPLRTGIEVLGIPLEEHLFMVVVPALVIGIHETRAELAARWQQ